MWKETGRQTPVTSALKIFRINLFYRRRFPRQIRTADLPAVIIDTTGVLFKIDKLGY